jgi:hypothetical protein
VTDQKPDEPDWRYRMAREDAQRQHDRIDSFFDKLNDATLKSSDAALRACLLVNGGVAVSVLAFIGGLLSKGLIEDPRQLKPIADSLVPFAWGVNRSHPPPPPGPGALGRQLVASTVTSASRPQAAYVATRTRTPFAHVRFTVRVAPARVERARSRFELGRRPACPFRG